MKASLVAVLSAETVGIIQYFVEVTFVENLSAVVATVVYLAVYSVSVCGFFFAFRYSWWVLISPHLIKIRFQYSSHDFYSGFEKNASRQTYRQKNKALSRYVCKEWWVLVQWRVLSPLATALWTVQIANWSACVVRVWVCARTSFFSSRLLAQLCFGRRARPYTPLRVKYCVPLCTLHTLVCQRVSKWG